MVKFVYPKCDSTHYKLIKWNLRVGEGHLGVYCFHCGKWFKFLRKDEEIEGVFCGIENKKQRPRRKKRLTN